MPTCMFCGSKVEKRDQMYYCLFCNMELLAGQVQHNGSRRQILLEEPISLEDAELSTGELMKKDSYYLTCLLRMVRKERSRIYHYLHIFKKANEQQGSFFDQEADTGSRYEYWTRKGWVLENILRERCRFFPEKIYDSYIQMMTQNVRRSNAKLMQVKGRKSK